MNKLAQILGIQFSNEIEISSITNTTDKVKEGSIFFALKGTQNHGSKYIDCLLYTSPSPRDPKTSRMPSSA